MPVKIKDKGSSWGGGPTTYLRSRVAKRTRPLSGSQPALNGKHSVPCLRRNSFQFVLVAEKQISNCGRAVKIIFSTVLNNNTCAILGDLGCRSEQACNVGKGRCREPNRGNTGPPLLPSCLSKGGSSVSSLPWKRNNVHNKIGITPVKTSSATKEEEIFEFVLSYDMRRIMTTTFKYCDRTCEFKTSINTQPFPLVLQSVRKKLLKKADCR